MIVWPKIRHSASVLKVVLQFIAGVHLEFVAVEDLAVGPLDGLNGVVGVSIVDKAVLADDGDFDHLSKLGENFSEVVSLSLMRNVINKDREVHDRVPSFPKGQWYSKSE